MSKSPFEDMMSEREAVLKALTDWVESQGLTHAQSTAAMCMFIGRLIGRNASDQQMLDIGIPIHANIIRTEANLEFAKR